jgi:hypothetical protein
LYTHPDISWDGKRVLFSYKPSAHADTSIYEIGIDGKGLRRLTDPSGISTMSARGLGMHDISPCYLPDGRIVFLSTRAEGLVPCNNTGVTLLHVMNADGSDIHPISVNSENEFDPTVMPDGRILFSRWEYIDKNALTVQSLWSVWPDGSNETAIYANNMTLPEAVLDARPVPGTHLIAAALTKHNAPPRGSIAYIDPFIGKNEPKAIYNFSTPDHPTNDRGHSSEPWPLDKDMLLCSGRPLSEGGYNVIEVMHRELGRVTLLEDERICLHDPMVVKPRRKPPMLPELADRSKKTGTFFVQDVYNMHSPVEIDGLEPVKPGEIKWLRVIEESSRISPRPKGANPYNQHHLVSGALAFATKIYHGIVPVNQDGSVYFEAPSGRLLSFQALDKDMRLIRSMRTFIQAAPGTVRSCIGCHEEKSNAPHSSAAANRPHISGPPRKLMAESWGTGYMDYPTRIQPIWDKHCVSCHGGENGFAGRVDLTGGWTVFFNNSYENLIDRKETQLIAHYIAGIDCMNGTADHSNQLLPAKSHGSAIAPLADIILSGHEGRVKMSQHEKDLVMAWIDSNGLYYGTWDSTKHGYESKTLNETYTALNGIMEKEGCTHCHASRQAPQQGVAFTRDWINTRNPKLSRILRAPMAKGGKGFGAEICRNHKMDPKRNRITLLKSGRYQHALKPLDFFPTVKEAAIQEGGTPHITFKNENNPVYREMLAVIKEGRRKILAAPRVDMPGAEIIAGADRMLVMPDVPGVAPPMDVIRQGGQMRISWPRTASNIGLTAELHFVPEKGAAVSNKTLVGSTLTNHLLVDPPAASGCYALVMKGDKAASSQASYTAKLNP